MAYWLEANLSFGFHKGLVNTFLQVFNNASPDVNVLTVAESSQYDQTHAGCALSKAVHVRVVQFPYS